MRSLVQSRVLANAGAAGLLTALVSYPRLNTWFAERDFFIPIWLTFLGSAFALWAFVFAWHFQYFGRRPLAGSRDPRLWTLATLCGVVTAVLLHFLVDPQLRLINPTDYPATWRAWAEMSLFNVAFDPLFLCFAPFAFFIRLFRRETTALVLTVSFGLLILFLKLQSSPALPPVGLLVGLMLLQIVRGFLGTYFYVKGGAWMVWWLVLLAQTRHFADLLKGN